MIIVRALKAIMLIIGILAVLMGLLWVGQGLGVIMWPAESFMLAEQKWAVYGAILASVGVLLIHLARRR